MQLSIALFRECPDGNLTASAQTIEQSALAGSGGTGSGVVQKFQELAGGRITFANFDAERSLPGRRTHDFNGNDLLDQFGLAEAIKSGRSQNDGGVFALF